MYLTTILGQGTQDQIAEWGPPAYTLQHEGAYAQTEIGQGSNLRGIETVADYDQA